MTVPSKQEFARMINQITGNQDMTAQKLDRILHEAKKSYQHKGMADFFEYIRKITQAPVSNEYMHQLMKQLQDPAHAEQLFKQMKGATTKKRKR